MRKEQAQAVRYKETKQERKPERERERERVRERDEEIQIERKGRPKFLRDGKNT